MNIRFFTTTLAVSLALPTFAQTSTEAPSGWKTQTKANGARTFTPPDLKAGEKYSVTVYDAAPLNGKTLEAYLRAFAGPVGTKLGQLAAPLETKVQSAGTGGFGTYNGPNGAQLGVVFFGLSLDGANIHVERVLFSSESLIVKRYKAESDAILQSLMQRAQANAGQSPAKQPPKAQEAQGAQGAQEAAREAEEKRFKWVTKPGKGIPDAQIAAVWLDSTFDGIGGYVSTTVYLLLRDGTVYADLPVPPDELDIARSKQHEPGKWGRWRKTAQGYSVSLNGKPFEELSGERVAPAPAQLRLAGRYGTGSGGSMGGFSSYAFWGVIFSKDGRFKKGTSGGASSSSGFGADASRTGTTFDDQGSSVVATGPGYVAGSSQKKRNPNGDREGTYSLGGYVLTLRYDNGRIERLPFFFDGGGNGGRSALWFEGATLTLDEGK